MARGGAAEGMVGQKVGNDGRMALATSLPTIRPLGWRRCRHDARSGASLSTATLSSPPSFGVGVPSGASNVVACSVQGDMM